MLSPLKSSLHLRPNLITFRTSFHLVQNVISFRTSFHLGQNVISFRTLLHLGSFITFRPSTHLETLRFSSINTSLSALTYKGDFERIKTRFTDNIRR